MIKQIHIFLLVLLGQMCLNTPLYAESLEKKLLEARLPTTATDRLLQLSTDSNWRVRREVAANRRLPEVIQLKLANDPVTDVKITLATNLATSSKTFAILAMDKDKTIRSVVARFEYVPAEILDILADDIEPDIRLEVARAYNTTPETLQKLKKDEYANIRGTAEQSLSSK